MSQNLSLTQAVREENEALKQEMEAIKIKTAEQVSWLKPFYKYKCVCVFFFFPPDFVLVLIQICLFPKTQASSELTVEELQNK